WRGSGDDDRRRAAGQQTVTLAFGTVAAAANDVGVTDDASPGVGDFAPDATTYSAQALAAVGIVPGESVVHHGVAFTWPAAPAGSPDNVEADGQVVALSGTGASLGFLGASTGAAHGGVGTVYYQDDGSQPFTVTLSDWANPGAA